MEEGSNWTPVLMTRSVRKREKRDACLGGDGLGAVGDFQLQCIGGLERGDGGLARAQEADAGRAEVPRRDPDGGEGAGAVELGEDVGAVGDLVARVGAALGGEELSRAAEQQRVEHHRFGQPEMFVPADDLGAEGVARVVLAQGDFDRGAAGDDVVERGLGIAEGFDPDSIVDGLVGEKADLPLLFGIGGDGKGAGKAAGDGAVEKIGLRTDHEILRRACRLGSLHHNVITPSLPSPEYRWRENEGAVILM